MIRADRIFTPARSFRLALMDAGIAAAVFYLLTRRILGIEPRVFFIDEHGAARLIPLIAILILTMYFSGLYDRGKARGRIFLLQQIALCSGVGFISQALIAYIYDPWTVPRNLALYGLVGCIFALFAWRLLRDALLARLEGTGTVLIVGADRSARRIARHIMNHPGLNLSVAGCLTNRPEEAVAPVLGGVAEVGEVARKIRPELIVVGLEDSRERMPVAEMVELRYGGFRIEEAGIACELICRCVSARDLRPSRMLFSRDFDAKDVSPVLAMADVLVAAMLLIAGAPLALIYGGALRARGVKPAIEKEVCAGFEGRPFVSRRLRAWDAGGPGGWARSLHLREWPQLWNVLRRRMSMVGPRPRRLDMAAEIDRILPVSEYRRNARPGITGWARINMPSAEPMDAITEMEYDLYFIRNQSFSLYTYVLLHGLRPAA